ncbi:MAG: GNAT family N-acetyltransferase [Actinomycetota bacterium]|nr:GNAT family N-acetyltransferase [Actinomycetota bacterium]
MAERLSGPRTDLEGLHELAPLWRELHRHHRAVSEYTALVEDLEVSWERRLRWYQHLLEQGASYLTTTDADGRLAGYVVVRFEAEPDDTFESVQGIPEVVTLVIAEAQRSAGLGRALLRAAEQVARDRGFDAMKIAVMAGNSRACAFYEDAGYQVAEHVLYRRFSGDQGVNMPPDRRGSNRPRCAPR